MTANKMRIKYGVELWKINDRVIVSIVSSSTQRKVCVELYMNHLYFTEFDTFDVSTVCLGVTGNA